MLDKLPDRIFGKPSMSTAVTSNAESDTVGASTSTTTLTNPRRMWKGKIRSAILSSPINKLMRHFLFTGTQRHAWSERKKVIVRRHFVNEMNDVNLPITRTRSLECQTILTDNGTNVTVQAVRCMVTRL